MTDAQLVLSMFPTADTAGNVARALVEERLAACCNIIPAVRSIYRWQDKLQDENEVLVFIKTRSEQIERVKSRILELHPYAVPEILALPVESGYAGYLEWLAQVTR